MRTRALAGLLAIVAMTGACSSPPVTQAEVGECFTIEGDPNQVGTIRGFDCSKEHDAEVYYKGDLGIEGDVDSTKVDAAAREVCLSEFSGYVGADYYASSLDIYYMFPLEDGWANGDREVVCAVFTPDYEQGGILPTSGSVKDSKK